MTKQEESKIVNRLEQIIDLLKSQEDRDKQIQSLLYKSFELQEKMLKDLGV